MKSSPFNQILNNKWFKVLINVLVLGFSIYLIRKRLADDSLWFSFQNLATRSSPLAIGGLVIFWYLNFMLDVKLWQKAVSSFHKISSKTAFIDNLKFYAYAFVSPANSGGLIARIGRYTSKQERTLALISSTQLGAARYLARISIGGSLSVYLIASNISTQAMAIASSIAFAFGAFIIMINLGRLVQIKWLTQFDFLQKLISSNNAKINFKPTLIILACLRFLSFNMQLVCILLIFGAPPSGEMFVNVPSFFFISTLIPALPAFDFIIKGAVGLFAFDYFNQMPDVLLVSTTLLWLMNWAIPALLGVFVKREKSASINSN